MTARAPLDVLEGSGLPYASTLRFRERHLPQGAPTSPALANLVAFRLDARLHAAAAAVGATYTRYADDLAFSGDQAFAAGATRFRDLVQRVAASEGFELHPRKDRRMRRSARQRLTGLVVNARPAPPRDEFDRLKAVLHNCVRDGPASQNRAGVADFRAHLRGRVAWFEHASPARGAKLRASFERITW